MQPADFYTGIVADLCQPLKSARADPAPYAALIRIPAPATPAELGRTREARAPDGAVLRFSVRSQEHDEQNRTQRSVLRYERHAGEESTVVDRTWTLHWHTRAGFRALAAAADLDTAAVLDPAGAPAEPDAAGFSFLLRPAGRSSQPDAAAAAHPRAAGAAPG